MNPSNPILHPRRMGPRPRRGGETLASLPLETASCNINCKNVPPAPAPAPLPGGGQVEEGSVFGQPECQLISGRSQAHLQGSWLEAGARAPLTACIHP